MSEQQLAARQKFTMTSRVNPGLEFVRALFLLQMLVLGLKLGEAGVVATWSWWWVVAPMWLMPASLFALVALSLPIAAIKWAVARRDSEVEIEVEDDEANIPNKE